MILVQVVSTWRLSTKYIRSSVLANGKQAVRLLIARKESEKKTRKRRSHARVRSAGEGKKGSIRVHFDTQRCVLAWTGSLDKQPGFGGGEQETRLDCNACPPAAQEMVTNLKRHVSSARFHKFGPFQHPPKQRRAYFRTPPTSPALQAAERVCHGVVSLLWLRGTAQYSLVYTAATRETPAATWAKGGGQFPSPSVFTTFDNNRA